MICKSCGKKVDINKKFCTNCGWKIEVPVVKEEEVKKVIPKEPVKNKREKKEVSISNKSLQNKYGSFFEKLSSNLKQKPVKSQVEKNVLKRKIKQSVSPKMEKKKVVENKGNQLNYFLLALLGMVTLGTGISLAHYMYRQSEIGSSTYEEPDPIVGYLDENAECCNEKFFSGLWLERKFEVLNEIIFRNPRDSEAFYQRAKTFESDGDFNSYCIDLEKSMGLGNRKARNSYYEKKYNIKEMERMSCESANLGKEKNIDSKESALAELNELLSAENTRVKMREHGIFAFDSNDINFGIDTVHFNSFGTITYQADVRKDGIYGQYYFNCATKKKWSYEDQEWIIPKTRDEKSLIKDMCLLKKNDPEVIPLIKSDGWKQYSDTLWVNVNRWEYKPEYNDDRYYTSIYDSKNQNLGNVTITCSDNNITFRSGGKYGDWYYAEGANKKILDDKCNS